MEIKYQTLLNDNQVIPPKSSDYLYELEPLSISEIVNLETAYNLGNEFPAALRELLFLAGGYCYVLDYGTFDTQSEIQERSRALLVSRNITISRLFFVIDIYSYGEQFLFVYLDEGTADPDVYQMELYSKNSFNLGFKLSDYINGCIKELLSGRNPF